MADNGKQKPAARVFAIIGENDEEEGKKAEWIEIGVAWRNRDDSLSFEIKAVPVAWAGAARRRCQLRFIDE